MSAGRPPVPERARLALLALTLLLPGCGVEVQREPEPIPANRLPSSPAPTSSPVRAEQVRVWGARDRRLVPVFVELTDTGLRARLTGLLELGAPGQRPPTALPAGTQLLRVRQDGDRVDVVLSDHLLTTAVADLPLALGQLVFTVTEHPGTRRVQVRAGDEQVLYVDAAGDTISRPLVRTDFDGLLQPPSEE